MGVLRAGALCGTGGHGCGDGGCSGDGDGDGVLRAQDGIGAGGVCGTGLRDAGEGHSVPLRAAAGALCALAVRVVPRHLFAETGYGPYARRLCVSSHGICSQDRTKGVFEARAEGVFSGTLSLTHRSFCGCLHGALCADRVGGVDGGLLGVLGAGALCGTGDGDGGLLRCFSRGRGRDVAGPG